MFLNGYSQAMIALFVWTFIDDDAVSGKLLPQIFRFILKLDNEKRT